MKFAKSRPHRHRLSRDFRITVIDRLRRDPAFYEALNAETTRIAAESEQLDMASHSEIQLNLEGQRRLAALMEQAPKPTKAMMALGELPDFEVNEGNV